MSLRARLHSSSSPAPSQPRTIHPSLAATSSAAASRPATPKPFTRDFLAIKTRIQNALLDRIDHPDTLTAEELQAQIVDLVEADSTISPLDKDAVRHILTNEILGYGPIQSLLDDPDVSEIMINGPSHIFIERQGQLIPTDLAFRDEAHLRSTLEKMLAFSGRRVDESSPMVDARLPDGSRLNAILRPIAVSGDTITIRKFARDPFVLPQLVQLGTLSADMAAFIQGAVEGRLNIVVSGGTGSGKTTTLNAVSAFIPDTERIITIEDSAELQLQQRHTITLEARPANIEGQGGISIRDLVRNALRMRPDRIIVGEVRGGEALDMLQAMNTGHEGSLTTVHANSPRDALSRIETMVLMAGADLPLPAIRTQIASALDLIIQQNRFMDGSRRIVRITEVVGMENSVITTQDLFVFTQTDMDDAGHIQGTYQATGVRPHNLDRMRAHGVELPPTLFPALFGLS
jgi:pilus assembly protein CpaF